MAGGYGSPVSDTELLREKLREINNRLAELERPTGTQTAQAVSQLRTLVEDLQEQVDNLLAVAVNTGDVHASGAITAGSTITTGGKVTATGGLSSLPVYANLLTSDYRSVYVTNPSGDFGYAPSSERFKEQIHAAFPALQAILSLHLVTFKYKAEVERLGDDAGVEWGLIAEELHEKGLGWLVDYDEDGLPFGVRYERVALAFLPVMQDQERRLRALERAERP